MILPDRNNEMKDWHIPGLGEQQFMPFFPSFAGFLIEKKQKSN